MRSRWWSDSQSVSAGQCMLLLHSLAFSLGYGQQYVLPIGLADSSVAMKSIVQAYEGSNEII